MKWDQLGLGYLTDNMLFSNSEDAYKNKDDSPVCHNSWYYVTILRYSTPYAITPLNTQILGHMNYARWGGQEICP